MSVARAVGMVGTALIAGHFFVGEMSAGQARPPASVNSKLDGLKQAAVGQVSTFWLIRTRAAFSRARTRSFRKRGM